MQQNRPLPGGIIINLHPRNSLDALRRWSDSKRRRPLVIRGARQVGKTTLVRLFAREAGVLLELNLERAAHAALFQRQLRPRDLFAAIRLELGESAGPESALLFLDEIQACPEAIEQLRYLHEDLPGLRIIAAGSLLDALLSQEQVNFPVGRVDYLFVFPLDFGEFLLALGEDRARDAYDTIPAPEWAHQRLLQLFHEYALVGGMPAIVDQYAEERDVPALATAYASLLTAYRDDVVKYARNETLGNVIRHCIEAAATVAGTRVTFTGFGSSSYGAREVGEALRALERSQLLYLLYPVTKPTLPLTPDLKRRPRLQFLDTGLLSAAAGLQASYYASATLHDVHRGLIAEHIVGQQLLAHESARLVKPAFWVREKKQSQAEVDYLHVARGHVIPVEVKAGASGTLRSLRRYMDMVPHDMAVRLYAGPLAVEEQTTGEGKPYRLLNLPYWLCGKLGEYVERFLLDE